ncbi:MAG TPA: xanthine dehydrogenase family protein molybdopterin-binding subunit [Egibacteraceae bacterium]|nr:xanthine dehydrogenase family protein molybdopterin-binding subunit [Egibacteraceae bacterium]
MSTSGERAPWAARRIDGRLLTGRGRYVGAVSLPGQLWAGVVRSPLAHGRLVSVDGEAARRLPGVHAVITGEDLRPVPRIPGPPHLSARGKLLHGLAAKVPGPVASRVPRLRRQPFGRALEPYRQPVLATGRVRYAGEPLALVVAEDPYAAEDAVDLVDVDISPLAASTLADDPASPTVWEQATANELYALRADFGDVDACFATADHVVSAELRVPRQTGLPMECRGLVAEWRHGGRSLHLWGPTKTVSFTRAMLAELFRIHPDQIVCHGVDVGGMFGVRGEFYPEDFLIPWAARVTGRPVKWIEDRREHLQATNHSREQQHRVALALRDDGTVLALRDEVTVDLGAYIRPVGNLLGALTLRALPGPYRWRALALRCRGIATNKTPVGPMRGPGETEATFVRERILDIAASRLGFDPVELRRRNLLSADDGRWAMDLGRDLGRIEYDDDDYRALFDDFLHTAHYARRREEVAVRQRRGEDVGLGTSCYVAATGSGGSETVTMELTSDGRFRVATSAAEVGQGLTDMLARVTGDALGVPPDAVDVVVGDSSAHAGGVGTFSSRSTVYLSGAVTDGAEKLLTIARDRAAEALGTAAHSVLSAVPEGLTAGGDVAFWKELAPITVSGRFKPHYVGWHLAHGFGAQLAVARIDPDTAEPRVEELVVGYDCGDVADAAAVRGQLVGGAVQGIGGTLFEALRYAEDGQPLSSTLVDYGVPTSREVDRVSAHVLTPRGRPPGTVMRGAGEPGILGTAAAVTNAAAAALGRHGEALNELPLTPDLVLRARNHTPAGAVRGPAEGPAPAGTPSLLLAVTGMVAGAALGWTLWRRRRAPRLPGHRIFR